METGPNMGAEPLQSSSHLLEAEADLVQVIEHLDRRARLLALFVRLGEL